MPITIAGTGTITGLSAGGLPDGCITTDDLAAGAATPAKLSQPLTLATAQATTSGTAIDFTGIPSWAKRITVMFNGVSTNGTSAVLIQLGTSGGIDASSYSGGYLVVDGATSGANTVASGFPVVTYAATDNKYGQLVICNFGGNTWTCNGGFLVRATSFCTTGGTKSLTGTLTTVRLTTFNGTDTFDAGSVNIMYE